MEATNTGNPSEAPAVVRPSHRCHVATSVLTAGEEGGSTRWRF
jgi:hypothetical protein